MFRRLPTTLPPDAPYTTAPSLSSLGYLINTSHQLRSTTHSTDPFRYKITTHERFNDCHCEAVKAFVAAELIARLSCLGIQQLWLPSLTTEKPEGDQAVLPILVTELAQLKRAKRVVLVINRSIEDLGIWASRTARGEGGIEAGSVNSLIKDVRAREAARGEDDETAFVVANPGQLLYSHKQKRAMSMAAWQAMQRPSALHAAPIVDEVANRVEGSRTVEEHLRSVVERVLGSEEFVRREARVFLIGVGDGVGEVGRILEEMCSDKGKRLNVAATALVGTVPFKINSNPLSLDNEDFVSLLARRSRAWGLSSHPLGTPLANATPAERLAELKGVMRTGNNDEMSTLDEFIYPSPTVSSGVTANAEEVMAEIGAGILDWFEQVAAADDLAQTTGGEGYVNETLEVSEEVLKEAQATAARAGWDDGAWGSNDEEDL